MATLTITTTSPQDARIIEAFRDFSDDDTVGAEEVKAWLIGQLRGMVRSYETRVANEAASAGVVDIDPS